MIGNLLRTAFYTGVLIGLWQAVGFAQTPQEDSFADRQASVSDAVVAPPAAAEPSVATPPLNADPSNPATPQPMALSAASQANTPGPVIHPEVEQVPTTLTTMPVSPNQITYAGTCCAQACTRICVSQTVSACRTVRSCARHNVCASGILGRIRSRRSFCVF